MDYYNYEEHQNKAFALLVSNAIQHLKSNGTTDSEAKLLVDDAIMGIINTIQDYKPFPNHVYKIIEEASKKKTVITERQVGMMCEILDRIEGALRNQIYEQLGYNNIVSFSEEKLRKEYDLDMNEISELMLHLLQNNDLDIEDLELDN